MPLASIKQTAVYKKWEARLKDAKARSAIASRIDRLAYGLAGDVASVGQGVSELRIHIGPGYRIYFCRRGPEIILLLCGGDKSSQERDIEMAKFLAREWES